MLLFRKVSDYMKRTKALPESLDDGPPVDATILSL